MTEWQWKVVMALVRIVMNKVLNLDWIEIKTEDENILHDALLKEDN